MTSTPLPFGGDGELAMLDLVDAATNGVVISLTGRISVNVHGHVADEVELGGQRARTAFALLVAERRRPVSRDEVAEVLWPGSLPASWEAAVRAVMSKVRAFFASAGLSSSHVLRSAFGCYQLHLPADTQVDLELAVATLQQAEHALEAGKAGWACALATTAHRITSRPLLPGVEGAWVEQRRHELASVRTRALQTLGEAYLALGDFDLAAESAREVVASEPYRESGWVLLMRALATAGNRGDALRAYSRCRELLAEELGVDPSAETERAYLELLREGPNPYSRPAPPHNLAAPLSTFVGRDGELRHVDSLLVANRLVTIAGPPGCGKSRLALEASRRVLEHFPGGVWSVDVAHLADADQITDALASALAVGEQPGDGRLGATLAELGRRPAALVVLDNCDQLLDGCAGVAERLLRKSSSLRVLITSREPLALPGETVWRLAPLAVPGPEAASNVEELLACESVRLLLDRARSVSADLQLTPSAAAAIVEICRRLDGLPLALELAAARRSALSFEEIADRLDDRFRLLVAGRDPTQVSLEAALHASHQRMAPMERVLFRRLSIFEGWTVNAAEAVCAGPDLPAVDVVSVLARLVTTSMVACEAHGRHARYRFLQTIRQYARGLLVESGESDRVAEAHLAWCVELAEESRRGLRGPSGARWLTRLAVELDNIRRGLEHAITAPHPELALRLTVALEEFWKRSGRVDEGRRWLEAAVQVGGGNAAHSARARCILRHAAVHPPDSRAGDSTR